MGFDFGIGACIHLTALIGLFGQATNAYMLRLPCTTYANFSIIQPNHTLTGHVLETYNNLNEKECENKCIGHKSCKSIHTKNTAGESCQLNSKSNEDPFEKLILTKNIEWTYKTTDHKARNIGYLCEEKRPCGCGMTCIDTCTYPGYECQETRIGSFHNCQDAYSKGYRVSTVFPICIPGMNIVNVWCDMTTNGGGWIVIQRRINASVDFNRGWNDYKNGFGDVNGNFWLGLEKLHKLTSPERGTILRVDLKHFRAPNDLKYAEYKNFEILGESEGYKLTYSSYSGNVDDSLANQYGKKFSTFDRDQDSHLSKNCALEYNGGWWFSGCFHVNLNGLYPQENQEKVEYMTWHSLHSRFGGVTFSEMKIKYNIQ